MSALGRGKRRGLSSCRALGAVAAALAASLAWAGAPAAEFQPWRRDPAALAGSADKLRRHRRHQPVDCGVQRRPRFAGRHPEPQPVRRTEVRCLLCRGRHAGRRSGLRPASALAAAVAPAPLGAARPGGQPRRPRFPNRSPLLRCRPCRPRSRRRRSGSSPRPISQIRSAPATGAPRGRRSRSSTPRATTSRYGSALTA